MSPGVLGVECNRLAKTRDCFGSLTLPRQNSPQADVSVGKRGSEPNRFLVFRNGLAEVSPACECVTEACVRFGEFCVQSNRLAQRGNRAVKFISPQEQLTKIGVDLGESRFEADRFAVLGNRVIAHVQEIKLAAEDGVGAVALWPQHDCFGEGARGIRVVGFGHTVFVQRTELSPGPEVVRETPRCNPHNRQGSPSVTDVLEHHRQQQQALRRLVFKCGSV